MKRILAWFFFIYLQVSLAVGINDAQNLLDNGKYLDSAKLAVSFDTAQGYALAAEAIILYAPSAIESQQATIYEQAKKYAEKAIQKDPNYAKGYLEKAKAIGSYSQKIPILTVAIENLPAVMKENLEKALKLEPDYPEAMIALAIWHAQIVKNGVAWLYKVDNNQTFSLCQRAINLRPNIIWFYTECAKAFLLIDKNKYKTRSIELLETAIKIKVDTVPEKNDLEQAKKDLVRLKN